jgi:hypothetical protein
MSEKTRDRGILTPADRAFLTGQSTMESEQSKRDARYRIRNRLSNGVLDFEVLLSSLEAKDRQKVFEKFLDEDEYPGGITSTHPLTRALSFFYVGIDEQEEFDEVLELAIEEAERHRGRVVNNIDVEISVDSEQPDVDGLINRIRAGESLCDEELDILVRKSDAEDLKILIREGIIEGEIYPADQAGSNASSE